MDTIQRKKFSHGYISDPGKMKPERTILSDLEDICGGKGSFRAVQVMDVTRLIHKDSVLLNTVPSNHLGITGRGSTKRHGQTYIRSGPLILSTHLFFR